MTNKDVQQPSLATLVQQTHQMAGAGRRASFTAAFAACADLAQKNPDLALHWLEALKTKKDWRRNKQLNTLIREITNRTKAEIQPSLF